MKSFFLLLATVAMVMAADDDDDTVIQASNMRVAANSLITCPDQSSTCRSGTACCPLENGSHGCCPYPEATCCSDNKHCCPGDHRCDLHGGRCVKAVSNDTLRWVKKERPSSLVLEAPEPVNTICPDGSICQGRWTRCCRTSSGSFRCCSYPLSCCGGGLLCCRRDNIFAMNPVSPGIAAIPWQELRDAMATPDQPEP